MRTIFHAAVDDRLIAETPCRNIALPEIVEDRIVPLTTQQVKALASAAPEDLAALVVFGAGTGLRSGEILGPPVGAVDFLRREVHVEQQLVYIPGTGVFLAPPKTRPGSGPFPSRATRWRPCRSTCGASHLWSSRCRGPTTTGSASV